MTIKAGKEYRFNGQIVQVMTTTESVRQPATHWVWYRGIDFVPRVTTREEFTEGLS